MIIDLESALNIITFALALVVLFSLLWLWKISRRDMLHSFTVIALVAISIFASGKFLNVLNLGFFGTNVFSNILELVLMLGIAIAIISFYGQWRHESGSST